VSVRASVLARVARRLEPTQPERAAQLLRATRDPLLAALAAEVEWRAGLVPTDLGPTRAALAQKADQAHARGDRTTELKLLTRLAVLSFHRAVQLEGPTSPLADDPDTFLTPLRESTAWQALTAPRGAVPRRAPGGRKVCVVTDGDLRFLAPLLPHLPPVDVVRLDEWDGPELPLTPGAQVEMRSDPRPADRSWAQALRARIGDAELVWVEWCQRAAVLVSQLELDVPTVVRLHSFEAFTVFPHLVDPSRVDAVVTVSPAFAELLRAVVPALGEKATVLPNALDPTRFAQPKTAEAARTLGLVGWGAPAKDACWALDVLAELRRADPTWRLRLVGPESEAPGYAAEVRARMAHEDVAGAVDVVGASDDVPGELTRIGALVSSSTRESFHLAVAEAAASGARVAVREWPTLSRYGGPHGVWPDDWVVRTPQQAAALLSSAAPQSPAPDLRPEVVAAAYSDLVERLASEQ
jgi:glycosyltransferase involved in cell wall biosynthesis